MLIIIIRTILLYFLIVFSIRLMGKKQLGELQPSELVTTIMISNIATLSLEDSAAPMVMGIVPILMIVSLDVIMSGIVLKNARVRKLMSGTARVVVSNGRVDQRELKNLRYTLDDLLESMREQGIFDITQVQYAIVETTGKINFFQKQQPEQNPPEVVVRDGVIDYDALGRCGLGEGWLKEIIRENKTTLPQVFVLSTDDNGCYALVKREAQK